MSSNSCTRNRLRHSDSSQYHLGCHSSGPWRPCILLAAASVPESPANSKAPNAWSIACKGSCVRAMNIPHDHTCKTGKSYMHSLCLAIYISTHGRSPSVWYNHAVALGAVREMSKMLVCGSTESAAAVLLCTLQAVICICIFKVRIEQASCSNCPVRLKQRASSHTHCQSTMQQHVVMHSCLHDHGWKP